MYTSVEWLTVMFSRVRVCRQFRFHFITTVSCKHKEGKGGLMSLLPIRCSNVRSPGEQTSWCWASHVHGTHRWSRERRRFQAKSCLVPWTWPPTCVCGALSELLESSLKCSYIQRKFRSSALSHLCDVHQSIINREHWRNTLKEYSWCK